MRGSRAYRAYDLTIASEVDLPALPAGGGPADVHVRIDRVIPPVEIPRAGGVGPMVVSANNVVFLASAGACSVRDGCEIVVDPAPGLDADTLQTWLLTRAFAVLLHQRGLFVLHADTVDVGGGAVAFTGESGRGKSTMAAAFWRAGHGLVTEDVSAVRATGGAYEVLAGYPMLKLDAAAADALGLSDPQRRHDGNAEHKFPVAIDTTFDTHPRSFQAVYVVTDGPAVGIEHLPHAEAVRVLIANAFCVSMFGEQEARALLAASAAIARATVVRRLVRPRSYGALDDTVVAIHNDLRSLVPS